METSSELRRGSLIAVPELEPGRSPHLLGTLCEDNPDMTAHTVETRVATPFKSIADVDTWADLVKAIDEHDGVVLVPMETLRKLEGAQRLGVHVLTSIGARLGTLGVGHMPDDLPNRQDQEAILYRYGTPASEVISAVRNGLRGAQDVRNTYHALYKLNALPNVDEVIHREDLDDTLTEVTTALLGKLSKTGRSSVLDMLGGV